MPAIDVITAGLETSVQDFPGRYGFWEQGFPPSGPFDMWSFRLANILVGNAPEAAGLECQFMGPTLRFTEDCLIALCGAEMNATLDGEAIAQWESVAVAAGQTLDCGFASVGARAYLAVSGGIEVAPVLGSRSTFHMAGVGGIDGHALKDGQSLNVNAGAGTEGRRVKEDCRPPISNGREWQIEVVQGPNDDWIAEDGIARFLDSEWKLQARSNRTGYRLEGPDWLFAEKASAKGPEHGEHPSNILDHGYPVGAVNLCGQTPIILVNDAPSAGGFINPFTVPSAAFWKLAQSKPNDIYRFHRVSVEEAQEARRAIDRLCAEESIQ
ncbi:MAG: biotin-dependent carboxyltransferase family protein [Alphaproteobacteria bacterium]|nr:biotin-dependent carboxyltransferase family protein [Alphaproteobacteria bacterium]MDP6589403.1 biotin-dependent carboxyltransferase family protein [Alphaproteobacteria bacterium]MDP6818571.1 biotin-dependent carboxyltransferase family protein [Alphaproteobacteria bacterium]